MPKHKKHNNNRGISANELLNLQPPPLQDDRHLHAHFRPEPRVDPLDLRRAFMMQNFQFVIRRDLLTLRHNAGLPQGQRRLLECLESPDMLVPWEAVAAVVMRTTEADFECPICLEPPIAARTAECGHVMCLPCALYHLHVQKAEQRPRTCPVCHQPIAAMTLRSCLPRFIRPVRVGETVVFDRFRKERGSCTLRRYDDTAPLGLTVDETNSLTLPPCMAPWSEQCRYVSSTAEFEASQRYREGSGVSARLSEIECQPRPLGEFDGYMERFLLEALNEVTKEHKHMASALVRDSPPMLPQHRDPQAPVLELYAQTEGQPYFLHMLTAKMLKMDAELRGEPLPDTVSGVVEEIVSMTQTPETRKIYKVFAHVPLHGVIKLCVVNLDGKVLPATREQFNSEIHARRERRRERDAHDHSLLSADDAWEMYKQRYRHPGSVSPSMPSEDCETDTMSLLQLPSVSSAYSDHGRHQTAVETRQRATKRIPDSLLLAEAGAGAGAEQQGEGQGEEGEAMLTPPQRAAVPSSCWSNGSSAARLKQGLKKSPATTVTQPTWAGDFQKKPKK